MAENPFKKMLRQVEAVRKIPEQCMVEFPKACRLMWGDQFLKQRDPYGARWGRTVTGNPFDKRQGLERALTSFPTSSRSFIMRCEHHAFVFHQDAQAPGRVRRLMFPRKDMGLGRWGKTFKNIAKALFRKAVGRSSMDFTYEISWEQS